MYSVIESIGSGGPHTVMLSPYKSGATSSVVVTPESRALQQAKNQIDLFYEEGKWDDYKKITNPYEYIFLSWNRRSSRSVATRQPLSRSYFKMIELWKCLDLSKLLSDLVERDGGLLTAHAAEGPGGFIEACSVSCDSNGWLFKDAYAITLRSEAKNVPGWRKAARFLESHPQVHIHDGADRTGNILLAENQEAFVSAVRSAYPTGVHLFTADGGFDFSNDYNAQEDSVLPLLLAETLLGLRVLTKGGALIIKCFDTKEQPTIDLIWLISRTFREWGLIKPRTSRAGNAERYIIGKGYLGESKDILDILAEYQSSTQFDKPILSTPACPSWKPVLAMIADLQEKVEHVEIAIIQETLELIKNTESSVIKGLVKANVQRSVEWCVEHDEEVAGSWSADLDRNVTRETGDLLQILNPTNSVSYNGWNQRALSTSTLSFEGFRSGVAMAPPAHNPFMRLKSGSAAAPSGSGKP